MIATMNFLFDTTENNLKSGCKNLSEADIIDICGVSNVHKGISYLNEDIISETTFNETGTIFQVKVRRDSDYTVFLRLLSDEVHGSCTCPVKGICKHLAAVLYYLKKTTGGLSDSDNAKTKLAIEQYLQSLSKQELVRLLQKYAPETFWTELENQHSDVDKARNQIKKVERKINKIFLDDDLMYDPLAFETEIDKAFSQLRGLEKLLPNECGTLIFNFLDRVETAQYEGMLYDDYNDSSFTSPDTFDHFVEDYALNLDFEEKLRFLTKLDLALENQSYDTFFHLLAISNSLFTFDELPLLKDVFLRKKELLPSTYKENFYRLVEHLLSPEEKEHLLISMQYDHPRWLIELVKLYDLKGYSQKALETLKKYMESPVCKKNEDVYALYLNLLRKDNLPLESIAEEALNNYPSQTMLLYVIKNNHFNTRKYEQIILQKRPEQGLDYLEKMNRLQEALELVCSPAYIHEARKTNFFKKHKINFPAEATSFFSSVITENLKEAGDRHYYAIVDAIMQLLVINKLLAAQILKDIRLNYKRRHKLIGLLEKL
jgi:hypothetical protein